MEETMKEQLLQHNEEDLKKKIWNESKKMWIVAGPAILIRFSTFGINVVSQAFVGHIGATELAAYTLVYSVLLRFSNGILVYKYSCLIRNSLCLIGLMCFLFTFCEQVGMNSGFGTLHGQAFGAKQYQNLGIYLQQGWIVLPTVSAILCPLLVFAAPILKALGQDQLIAETAGIIALWFIPLTFSFAVLCASNMFLQSQSKIVVLSCLSTFSLLVHVFLSWLLTVRFEFGMTGAMVSTTLAYWIPNVGQIIYIFCGGCRETWRGFTALAFKDIGHTVKIGVSSCLMFRFGFCFGTKKGVGFS